MSEDILFAGGVHGVFVFFKAFQQRNVAWLNYWWVMPTSYLMSITDVAVISVVTYRTMSAIDPSVGWSFTMLLELLPLMLILGTCSGIGTLSAMWLHSEYVGKQ